MRRRPFQMSRRQRLALYGTFALTVGTGVAWALLIHGFRDDPEMELPAEGRLMQAHLAGALLLLVAFGSALPTHAVKSWEAGINRTVGLAFVAAFTLTVLTGYGILAFVPDTQAIHWTHLGAGALMVALLIAHIVAGRTAEARRKNIAHGKPSESGTEGPSA